MYPPEIIDTLACLNAHPRDANIEFDPDPHIYTVNKNPSIKYTSVTTWIHSHFSQFDADVIIDKMFNSQKWGPGHKYWGMTRAQIKSGWDKNRDAASSAGTDMHYRIECFHNMVSDTLKNATYTDFLNYYNCNYGTKKANKHSREWQFFLNYVEDHPTYKPYRTEWMVYHEELQISGSIDMIYELEDGSLAIYDWKRAREIVQTNTYKQFSTTNCIRHLPDTNYWHYTLQLNIYKTILEEKYGKCVKELCLVVLHPDNANGNYMLYPVPIITKEIKALFKFRKAQVAGGHIAPPHHAKVQPPVPVPDSTEPDEPLEQIDYSTPMF
jgi:hypothetical protein